jgi:hypothetical protein
MRHIHGLRCEGVPQNFPFLLRASTDCRGPGCQDSAHSLQVSVYREELFLSKRFAVDTKELAMMLRSHSLYNARTVTRSVARNVARPPSTFRLYMPPYPEVPTRLFHRPLHLSSRSTMSRFTHSDTGCCPRHARQYHSIKYLLSLGSPLSFQVCMCPKDRRELLPVCPRTQVPMLQTWTMGLVLGFLILCKASG